MIRGIRRRLSRHEQKPWPHEPTEGREAWRRGHVYFLPVRRLSRLGGEQSSLMVVRNRHRELGLLSDISPRRLDAAAGVGGGEERRRGGGQAGRWLQSKNLWCIIFSSLTSRGKVFHRWPACMTPRLFAQGLASRACVRACVRLPASACIAQIPAPMSASLCTSTAWRWVT